MKAPIEASGEERVIEAIRLDPGLKFMQLRTATKLPLRDLSVILRKLLDEGKVERTQGRYFEREGT